MGATKKHKQHNTPSTPSRQESTQAYAEIRKIDGQHPYKQAVPNGYVDYQVRTRHGGRVVYFNFDLAIEMGLIPASHPRTMTKDLRKALLDTFAIQIINEYDMIHGTPIPKKDIKPHRYMATRYLQLQHPDKRGTTSGDGRSIWNGSYVNRGGAWDISSCGTGATCLSPATAIEKKFFRTGDPQVCYGCGHADLYAGVGAALFSEVLHKSGVPTERTLAVIGFNKGLSINVRAGRNLLRPSHFFMHLRQGNYASLKSGVDFFIDRQIQNGEQRYAAPDKQRYDNFAEQMAITFARSAAIFESQYLFVWMDWDGDNILADGGIIDYGSVRQFGLFHHEYRYDDVDRMSTNISEQRGKARHMVQSFAQVRDFLVTGVRKNRNAFNQDKILKLFDRTFDETMLTLLMQKLGFDNNQVDYLMRYQRKTVEDFRATHTYFERAKAKRGIYKVADGVTWDAVYCMRDLMREMPQRLMGGQRPTFKEFMDIMASSYAKRSDRALTPNKTRRMQTYMKLYEELVAAVAKKEGRSNNRILLKLSMRSGLLNRADRVTGNSVLLIAERSSKASAQLKPEQFQALIDTLVTYQVDVPERVKDLAEGLPGQQTKSVAKACLRLLKIYKDGL